MGCEKKWFDCFSCKGVNRSEPFVEDQTGSWQRRSGGVKATYGLPLRLCPSSPTSLLLHQSIYLLSSHFVDPPARLLVSVTQAILPTPIEASRGRIYKLCHEGEVEEPIPFLRVALFLSSRPSVEIIACSLLVGLCERFLLHQMPDESLPWDGDDEISRFGAFRTRDPAGGQTLAAAE